MVGLVASCKLLGIPSRRPASWEKQQPDSLIAGPWLLKTGANEISVLFKTKPQKRPPVVEYWRFDEPATAPASQPASRAASQPASRAASPPASRAASQPTSRAASQPASRAASQPASSAAGRVVARAASAAVGPSRRVRAENLDWLWIARLRDLPAGARFNYWVVSDGGRTVVKTFKAGAPAGSAFRFVAYGDTRTRNEVHWAVVKAMAREKIDFVVHSGDIAVSGLEHEWLTFLHIVRPVAARAPIYGAIGNHDVSAEKYFRQIFLPGREAYQRYYASTWGDLRMIFVDTEIELRAGSTQHRWLVRQLARAVREDKLIMLTMHYPAFSSGKHGSSKRVQRVMTKLGPRYGVELVVAGHDHNYERIKEQQGVCYVVSGSAGAPIRPIHPRSFSAVARTEPHFVIVDVERRLLKLRAINLSGETIDYHVVKPNPPRP